MSPRASQRPGWVRLIARFFARFFASAVIAVLLLFAAAAVWVHRALTPERLQPMIIAQLERTFQRRVEIEGVGAAILQGVRVTGLKVHSSPGDPEELFLSSDVLLVTYSLPALLQGRFVLTKASLVNPRVNLYRPPGGAWNLAEMLRNAGRPAGGRMALPPLSAADSIRLEGGIVRVSDPERRLDMRFKDVRLVVDDFSLDKPFAAKARLANESTFLDRRHTLSLEADMEVDLAALAGERTAVSVRRLTGTFDGRRFEAAGKVRSLAHPDFDARLSLPAMGSAELRQLGAAAPDGLRVPESRWDVAVKTLFVKGSTVPASYFLSRFAGSAGPWRVEASGRVGAADQALSATFKTRSAPLGQAWALFGPLADYGLAGTLDAAVTLGGTLAAPRVAQTSVDLRGFYSTFWNGKRFTDADIAVRTGPGLSNASVRVSKGSYIAYSNVLSDLAAEVVISSSDLAVPRLDLTWNGSRVRLKGCVRDVRSWRKVAVDAEVDHLRVDETYTTIQNLITQRMAELGKTPQKDKPWAAAFRMAIPDRFPDMAGRLRVSDIHSPNFSAQNLDLVWNLKDIAKELKTVAGHFQLGFGPGSLQNIVELQKSHPLVNVLLIPYVELHKIRQKSRGSLETAIPTGLDFTRAFGDFGAGNGVVGVNFIHFDSRPFQAFTAGTADFPKEAVDLNVIMKMTEPAQNLPYYMTTEDGHLALDVSLVKDLNHPEVVFHTRKVGEHDIEKGLEDGLKRVQPLPDLGEAVSCRRGG